MADNEKCAHDACTCDVEGPKAFVQGGSTYCSSACAAGDGCDHSDCNCGGPDHPNK